MYTSSKAALTQAGEAWRLELAPLGVRVITLMTGGVATNFTGNIPALELPKSSYYLGVEDVIRQQQSQKPEDIPMSTKPEDFAQEVLRLVERGATGTHNKRPRLERVLTPHNRQSMDRRWCWTCKMDTLAFAAERYRELHQI
jgi:NAD(P)-dependent dehydrogenase (short-subunit alcohol dehydrogenase family)